MKEKLLYFCTSLVAKLKKSTKPPSSEAIKSIVLFKFDDIGDMVYTLHVFDILHEAFPQAEISLFCKPINRIFFEHVPYVTCIDEFPQNKQDIVVDLRGNFKTLWFGLWNAKHYVDRGTVRWRNKRDGGQKQEVHTNFSIIEPLLQEPVFLYPVIKLAAAERKKAHLWLEERGINDYVLIHTGANAEDRRWPKNRFAQLATSILDNSNKEVIFVGGPHEADDITLVQRLIQKKTYSTAGEFNLLELAAICEGASAFVGNESGPVHIATAMNCPVVALFGPGVVDVFYPYHEKARIIHHHTDFVDSETGEDKSMQLIQVEEVVKALESLAI